MATRARREESLPEGDPALLHGDPDLRPGQLDGLIVDGQDAFAARRRMMRELHDGRPDPAPAPARFGTRPAPAPPVIFPHVGMTGEMQIITAADFDALPAGRNKPSSALKLVALALARGDCVSLPVEPTRVRLMCGTLRKLAKRHGMKVEIRSGHDYVAARMVGPQTGKGD